MVRALLQVGMRASRWLAVAAVGVGLAAAGIGLAGAAEAGAACRDHRTALQEARAALAEGKRDAALAALLQAKELLTRCRREEARHATLLAATTPAPGCA